MHTKINSFAAKYPTTVHHQFEKYQKSLIYTSPTLKSHKSKFHAIIKCNKAIKTTEVHKELNQVLTMDMKGFLVEAQNNIVKLVKARNNAHEQAVEERRKRLEIEKKYEQLKESFMQLKTVDDNDLINDILGNLMPSQEFENVNKLPNPDHSDDEEEADPKLLKEHKNGDIKNVISLKYKTDWENAYIHYNADDKGWTELPGIEMGESDGMKCIDVEAENMEFVLTDGQGNWDKPYHQEHNTRNDNYNIDSPGKWLLDSGIIHNTADS